MTKEDRLTDIQNQISYMNQVYKTIETEVDNGVKLIVLGFSQGTATALRWIVNQNISPYKLLLWAGTIPPDLKAENENADISKIDTIILKGDTDPYSGTIYMKQMDDWLKFYKINYKLVNYSGGHSIHIETLKQLAVSF
jgi:predicted esterase